MDISLDSESVAAFDYKASHPWITFEVRSHIQKSGPEFWMALGEARSKCQHLEGTPLRSETAEAMRQIYLVKGVAGTVAIEGNTLSEEQVAQRIQEKLSLPKSQEYLGKEVDNIYSAFSQIQENILTYGATPISEEMIRDLNRIILKDIDPESDIIPGEYTTKQLGVLRYRTAPPQSVPYLMERYCEWLNNGSEFQAKPGDEVITGIVKAIIAHLYFVWIHPFGNGNGRTARMLEVKFLLESGIPDVASHLLSNYYNKTRARYYKELDGASKSGGDIRGFLRYAIGGLVEELRDQIEFVKNQHKTVAWENYVHQVLEGVKGTTNYRRRRIVLALTNRKDPVRRSEVPDLSSKVKEAFMNAGGRTLSRDLNALLKEKLIRRSGSGYMANADLILAFRPLTARQPLSQFKQEAQQSLFAD